MDSLHGFGLPCLQWARGNCDDLEVEIHRTQDGSKSEVVVSANVAVVATGQRQRRPVSFSTDRADSLSWRASLCLQRPDSLSWRASLRFQRANSLSCMAGLPVSPKGRQPPMTVPLLLQVNGMQRRPVSYSTDRLDSLSWRASLLLQRADSLPWRCPCCYKSTACNAALLAIAQTGWTASHGEPPCFSKGSTASHGEPPCFSKGPTASHGEPPCFSKGLTAFHGGPLCVSKGPTTSHGRQTQCQRWAIYTSQEGNDNHPAETSIASSGDIAIAGVLRDPPPPTSPRA